MIDIVERLRADGETVKTLEAKGHWSSAKILEQADTITALREEVERLVKSRNRWGQKYNDLLKKRRAEDGYDVYAKDREEYRKKIAEQASEIEKLRTDVRLAVMCDSEESKLLTAENARLREEVERLGRDYETARDAHDRRVRELDAHCVEVARLRAALEWIGRHKKTDELILATDVEYAAFEDDYDACIDRARAAIRALAKG